MATNTVSSSVSCVHAVAAGAVPVGFTATRYGTILRPLMPPCALMSLMIALKASGTLPQSMFTPTALTAATST